MIRNNLIRFIILSIVYFSGVNCCIADFYDSAFSPIKTINPDAKNLEKSVLGSEFSINLNQSKGTSKFIDLSENDVFYHFISATDRFVQANIRASWEDFKTLISDTPPNDFMYMSYSNKMAELGFFDLSNFAASKIKDKDISNLSIDAMKRFYFPRRKLKFEDELFLAEIYSNIIYNNQSSEATYELSKNEALLSNSDYANYLMALGYYKSKYFSKAAKYINLARIQNPSNLNYQKLEAEIFVENNEPELAMKIVNNLKKQNLYSYEYERKVNSLEQFILYKTQKNEGDKNYHLGYYYYLENDPSKAIRTLQNALSAKKKASPGMINALISEVYFSINEFEKAADTAKKAYRFNKNNTKALMTLGNLSYREKKYKQALDYYKKASGNDKKAYAPLIKEAQAYQKLSNEKKAREIYTKVLKTHSDSWEAYYNIAMLASDSDKTKQAIYLKKALAVNPLYEDAWIELAKIDIDKGNYDIAQQYLANAFYIDENDFRYYYYQGQVNNNLGDFVQAKYNFKKCLKLNAKFTEAQKALDGILSPESSKVQDNI